MSKTNCTNTMSSNVSLVGSRNGFVSAGGLGSGDGFIMTIVRTLLVWQERVSSRSALRSMDLHRLKDVGLSYEQATSEFEKPFWKA